ncbi:MAG: hypothetical protein J5827_00935 [Oscillospiraceae bacterium]|nr:hypothetical protein [Oscillospiraceae bacterium]
MKEYICAAAAARFELKKLDIGEYGLIKGGGMKFDVSVYDAAGAGRLCLMDMKAFAGLMRMETAVFSPTELDGPLFSMDFIKAFGKTTLLLELYDTTLSHPDFDSLCEIKAKYAGIPAHDPGEHWYDYLRLEPSDFKKVKGKAAELEPMVKEYGDGYFGLLSLCGRCDPAEKMKKNAEFTDGLLNNGGPAVDQFKKLLGEEKAAEFLKKYMFCCTAD